MRRWAIPLAVLAVLAACVPAPSFAAAGAAEEQKLIGVLQSDRPAVEKDSACARLKQIGTARCVPALAALLTDETLSHSARYALESMHCPEAGEALRAALPKASGPLRAGIADSLGHRADRAAAPALAKLLAGPDAAVAAAAATALGRTGGPEALAALKAALATAPAKLQPAVADGLLLCADGLRAEGDQAAASGVYRQLFESRQPEHVRTAAYRGLVLAGGAEGAGLVAAGLKGEDRAARLAALRVVRDGGLTTKQLAALLADAPAAAQVAVIHAMAERGDAAGAAAVGQAAKSPDPSVRIAALEALGALANASSVPSLAEAAAAAQGDEQKAARRSLARLRGAGVTGAILAHLPKASPAVQMELVRALADRQDATAVPTLLEMSGSSDAAVQAGAVRALASLADDRAAGKLIGLLVAAKAPAVRGAVEEALGSIAGRSKDPEALADAVLAAGKSADVEARCVLLRVAGRIGGTRVLEALRAGVADADDALRDAAVRTMAETAGPDAAPDLLALAKGAASATHRVLALRGYLRLAGTAELPTAKRLEMCRAAVATAPRPDDKKLLLARLASVSHPGALELAGQLGADPAVVAEAEAARLQIALAMGGAYPAEARAALEQLRAGSKRQDIRDAAAEGLGALGKYEGYVANWLVAGPYRQQGKGCSQLYDVPFPPEQPGGAKVTWQPAPHPADPSLRWQVDLGPIVGGDHCIVYLRTRVYSPQARPVRLEIGTDDGIKLWINGRLVHANNAIRGLTPAQDKATATLKAGWNDLLAKITQHTQGCGACIRVLAATGEPLDDLRCDPAGEGP